MSLGIEELNKGDYGAAQYCFDEAIKRDPTYGEAYRYRGQVFRLVGDYDRAKENLDKSISLDSGNVEAYIARGQVYTEKMDFDRAAEDFRKAVELDPDFVADYFNSAYSSGVEVDAIPLFSPYDTIRIIRQYKIVNGVSESIAVRRTQQGLPKAMADSELGLAAWRVSYDLAGVDVSGQERVDDEYSQRVKEGEYDGWTGIAYFREVWAMDTPDEVIISEMTDVLCSQIGNFAYEDFGMGMTCGYPNDDHSLFGVFIALGYGCSDGSAYAVAHINRVRGSSEVPALELNYSLRTLARSYIALDTAPDDAQRLADLQEAGYGEFGVGIRSFYNGAYSPVPEDIDQLTYEEMGNLAASGLLAEHQEVMLLPVWQDIGVAVRLMRHSESAPLSVYAEIILGRHLAE